MDVQTEIQSPTESSTETVFDDYSPMNAYDTYSSINDSSELWKFALSLLRVHFYAIVIAWIMFKGDIQVSEDTDLTESINLQKSVTYDELRQKNREEFYKKQHAAWHKSHSSSRESPVTREPAATDNPSPMQEKTKYGDVWN